MHVVRFKEKERKKIKLTLLPPLSLPRRPPILFPPQLRQLPATTSKSLPSFFRAGVARRCRRNFPFTCRLPPYLTENLVWDVIDGQQS
ncbi:hypothetical protein Csa_011124 [Cucumis sativus]|uniref:Uncharacterized protein n=1 Tax=Cucumis sativus TaxID=3659 RepID=A0A0A0L5W9_CUCSA|nr:hypothetical protein Csa_011124 [Cucumis sativus]